MAKRGSYYLRSGKAGPNQVVLDSLDPRVAGSGDEGDGSVAIYGDGSVSFVDGSVDFLTESPSRAA